MSYPKISIVVPLYNVEKHITPCISSIITQDYPDFEVIIVDDGSSDNSKSICERVLSNSSVEYKMISRNNKGVSASRNDGINAATGEYVCFVDADDIIDVQYLSKLYRAINKSDSSSVVFSSYNLIYKNTKKQQRWINETNKLNKKNVLWAFLNRDCKFIITAMMVNRKHIMDNKIYFDEDCRYSEDIIYIWKILCSSKDIRFIDEPLYNYIIHPGSTMTSSNYNKIVTCRDAIIRLFDDYISKVDNMETFQKSFLPRYFFAIMHSAAKLLNYNDFRLLSQELDIKTIFRLKSDKLRRKQSFLIKLYYINFWIFYLILRWK
ncbi:glycosyltransferase family 2 protein [Proteiniclasticum ruminis]|nr:glycosyltransferase [Proteiniclasticum ruminis]